MRRRHQIDPGTTDPRDVDTIRFAQLQFSELLAVHLRFCNQNTAVDELALQIYPFLTIHLNLFADERVDRLRIILGSDNQYLVVFVQHRIGRNNLHLFAVIVPDTRKHKLPVSHQCRQLADRFSEHRRILHEQRNRKWFIFMLVIFSIQAFRFLFQINPKKKTDTHDSKDNSHNS